MAEFGDYCYLLESIIGPEKLTEYSFIGSEPLAVLRVRKGRAELEDRVNGHRHVFDVSDPLNPIKALIPKLKLPERPRFLGGFVGYVGYDCIRYWERVPDKGSSSLGLPDLEFGLFADGFIFDHKLGRAYYYSFIEDRSQYLLSLKNDAYTFSYSDPRSNVGKDRFEEMVRAAKEYIAGGDIFQVVLSRRYEFEVKGEPMGFYERLRLINPSPYMYYLKFGRNRIIGSSPEMLVRVEGRRAETYPIAGTRPLTDDERENERLAKELLNDAKERAEHVMLVDLARNDLGRVCRFGTIRVPEFMTINRYSHVQHIVSRVVGELEEGYDRFDALRAVFPAGTVSGAPKVRAMEIIEELEPCKREVYAGGVGYFSFNDNADFAITIRTLVSSGNKAFIQVGAGIVSDSIPENEWYETEHKAKALLKALGMVE
jgi:anthranilate synthase component 1